jgi:opacity protein-like surface antigen
VALDATFGSASKTAFGVNVGGDVNYRITGGIGAGAFFRYVYGKAKMPGGDTTRDVTLGGPQIGVGLRYRF